MIRHDTPDYAKIYSPQSIYLSRKEWLKQKQLEGVFKKDLKNRQARAMIYGGAIGVLVIVAEYLILLACFGK